MYMNMTYLVVIASIFAIYILNFIFIKLNRRKCPPLITGWIPWMGVGIEFGIAPLTYINAAKIKYGNVFTVLAAGKYLTFLMDFDDHCEHFFNSKCVDFKQAVVDSVENAASISPDQFFKYHTEMHDIVKCRLAPAKLHNYYANLSKQFSSQICKLPEYGEKDLMELTRQIMFGSVVKNLIGEEIALNDDQMQEIEEIFVKFNNQFETGTQIPGFLLRDWTASKEWLLKRFKNVQKELPPVSLKSMTVAEQVMRMDANCGPNFVLLLFWASQANTIPITYWTLVFLLTHPEELDKVSKELYNVFGKKTSELVINEDIISKLPSIKRCILEAIRLRSPGVIIRKVIKPFGVKGYKIPVGDVLAISPYWSHRDPRFFPDPDSFKPMVCFDGNANFHYCCLATAVIIINRHSSQTKSNAYCRYTTSGVNLSCCIHETKVMHHFQCNC